MAVSPEKTLIRLILLTRWRDQQIDVARPARRAAPLAVGRRYVHVMSVVRNRFFTAAPNGACVQEHGNFAITFTLGLTALLCGCSQTSAPVVPNATNENSISEPVRSPVMTGEASVAGKPDDAELPPLVTTTPQVDTASRGELPSEAMDHSEKANQGVANQGVASRTAPQQKRFRLADDRPDINELRLRTAGIHRYDGQHVVLLSDLPPEKVKDLPGMIDQLFLALETYFGELPEATDGSDFQVTGHLIGDKERFQAAGLMPMEGFTFKHGRHWNYQFWMMDQDTDYYQRHLAFHEFTHCFMTCESGMLDIPPLWYIEGMAEFFATHRRDHPLEPSLPQAANASALTGRSLTFGVLPDRFEGFEGWGRISELRRTFELPRAIAAVSGEFRAMKIPSLSDVMTDHPNIVQNDLNYALSWALCWFLESHPEYQKQFPALRGIRTRNEFLTESRAIIDQLQPRIAVDWVLFVESLREGFDSERSFPTHREQSDSASTSADSVAESLMLQADREWQETGWRLKQGNVLTLTCSGRYVVNETAKPWISEPQGVSIDYVHGLPLGQVTAILVAEDGSYLSDRISVGTGTTVTAPRDVTVWMQINDSSADRHNNSGHAEVTGILQSR